MKFPADTLAIANLYALLSAINASVAPIVISLGGLAGAYLLAEDKSLATLPVSGFNVGVAMMASPASLLVLKIGRHKIHEYIASGSITVILSPDLSERSAR